jgi:lysyl-tRNA synthetase class 2
VHNTQGHGGGVRPQAAPRLPARWLARLVTLAGLVDIVAMLMPRRMQHLGVLADIIPLIGLQTARAVTGAVGLLLVYLGAGLRRGKREAWWMAVVLAAVSVVVNIVKGFDVDAAAVSALVLVMLLTSRDEFPAAADRMSRWRAIAVAAGFALAGYAAGILEVAARHAALVAGQPARLWFVEVAYGMVGVTGPLQFKSQAAADGLAITTATMGCSPAAPPSCYCCARRPSGRVTHPMMRSACAHSWKSMAPATRWGTSLFEPTSL